MSNHSSKASVCARSRAVKKPFSLSSCIGVLLPSLMISSATLSTPTSAATVTVGNTGDPASGIGNATKCNTASNCTLRDAIAKALASGGDTIAFNLPVNSKITLGGHELVVDRNLSIDGSAVSGLTISGNNSSRGFKINPGVVATLKALVVTKGNPDDDHSDGWYGGGIYNGGTLTLDHCTVSGNTAHGGAGIHSAYRSSLTLNDSTVSGNTASDRSGGGIRARGRTSIALINSAVTNNAAIEGGGIFASDSTLTIDNANISDNTGEGINFEYKSVLVLTNSIISRNHGGGIRSTSQSNLTLINSSIIDNDAIGREGGGILNDFHSTLNASNATITGNVASIGGGVSSNFSDSTFVGSNISNNSAEFGGGIDGTSHTLVLNNSKISGNTAQIGGGISGLDSHHTLIHSNVSSNTATIGGGIFSESNSATNIVESTISFNTATNGFGGGIGNQSGAVSVIKSKIFGNTAINGSGGGIFSVSGMSPLNLSMSESIVYGNTSENYGGGVSIFNGNTIIENSSIRDNISTSRGGGIYNRAGTIFISDAIVSSNSSNSGGGIFNVGTLALNESIVSGNSANTGGGIVNNKCCTLDLTNSTVSGNTASDRGGGIYNGASANLGGNGALALIQSTLASNFAAGIHDDIYNNVAGAPMVATNAIVQSCILGGDSTAAFTDNGGNLDAGSGCGFTEASSKSNATLDLGTLADNGGPTLTIMPGANSDAIGFGLPDTCRNAPVNDRDQRGYVRPAVGCSSGAADPNASANDSIFFDGFGFGGQ